MQTMLVYFCHEFNWLNFGTEDAKIKVGLKAKEGTKMKTTLSIQGAYLGAGIGLVLFGMFGLMPGMLIGGALGISLAGIFFGLPLESGLFSRLIVLTSMLLGVIISGTLIVTASSSIGWIIGDSVRITVHENTLMKKL